MKNLIKKVSNRLGAFLGALFFKVPWITILLIGLIYTIQLVSTAGSGEQASLYFGAIGITAALSGLAYAAHQSVEKDDPNRIILIRSAEMLFHATVCFSIALIMKFVVINSFVGKVPNHWFFSFFMFTLYTTVWGLFVLGITETTYSLKKLSAILNKPME